MKKKEQLPAMVEKSLGDGSVILVSNPDLFNYEPMIGKKLRRKITNIQPKKKKRK